MGHKCFSDSSKDMFRGSVVLQISIVSVWHRSVVSVIWTYTPPPKKGVKVPYILESHRKIHLNSHKTIQGNIPLNQTITPSQTIKGKQEQSPKENQTSHN